MIQWVYYALVALIGFYQGCLFCHKMNAKTMAQREQAEKARDKTYDLLQEIYQLKDN